MRTLFLAVSLLLLPAALRAQVSALVVGHGSPERVEQASAVAQALRAAAPEASVRLLTGTEATSASVRGALFQLLSRRPSDVFVYVASDVALQRYPSGAETGWLLLEGTRPAAQPSEVPESAFALQPVVAQLAVSSARRVVLALDVPFAGLAVPEAPVHPDTFLAVVAGRSAGELPLGRAVAGAASYAEAVARLLGVESAVRFSLQPARGIARTRRPGPTTATLVLPPLPRDAQAFVDGSEVTATRISLGEGDHLLHVTLNGTDLWRPGLVLVSGETRTLAPLVEALHPVRLVPSPRFPGNRLSINGVLTPLQDTIRVAPGFLSLAVEQRRSALRAGSRFAPGSVVRLDYSTRFSPSTALSGVLAPGTVQYRQGARIKGVAMLGAAVGGAAAYFYGTARSRDMRQRYQQAQQAYVMAEGEAATREARAALAAAYGNARRARTRAHWAGWGLTLALTLNSADVLAFHARPPRIVFVPVR